MDLEKLKEISGELCMYGLDTDSADYIALEGGILVERNHYGKGELSCAAVAVWSSDRIHELLPDYLKTKDGFCCYTLNSFEAICPFVTYSNMGKTLYSVSGDTPSEAIYNMMKWLLQQPEYKEIVLERVAKFVKYNPIPDNISVPTISVTYSD